MKRKGYKFAIAWIAENDCPADNHVPYIMEAYISVCLVADMFQKTAEQVAGDVYKYRVKNAIIYRENNK